jgi:hypothetical protein
MFRDGNPAVLIMYPRLRGDKIVSYELIDNLILTDLFEAQPLSGQGIIRILLGNPAP